MSLTPLLQRESWDTAAPFLPILEGIPETPQALAEILLGRPGRFRPPLPLTDKLALRLFAASSVLDHFELHRHFFFAQREDGVPFAWRALLLFLEREGIIGAERYYHLAHDIPQRFFCKLRTPLTPSAPGEFVTTLEHQVGGWGTGADFETALSRAVGENLERFFLRCIPADVHGSVQQLRRAKRNFLPPEAVSQFTEEQRTHFSRYRLSDEQPLLWVKGEELLTQKSELIPAQCVDWEYTQPRGEPILRQPNTNACAGGFSQEEAILSGLYEAIERDGFMIYWLSSTSPPVIDVDAIDDAGMQTMLTHFRRYRFEVKFLNVTTDIGLPSFVCVLIDRGEGGPRVSIGGGSGFDIPRVLEEMAYKTLGSYQNTCSLPAFSFRSDGYVPWRDLRIGLEQRLSLWHNPAMFPKIEPWLSGPLQSLSEAFPNLPHFNSVQEEYQAALERFRKLGPGYEIYVYERKHPVLTKLGYHVVKVLVPELVHLYLNEAYASLGAKRLKTVPPKLGYGVATEWNPWPHPFP